MNPELVQLVRARGEDYWRGELKKAQVAVIVYGVVLLIAIGVRVAFMDTVVGTLIPWLALAGATIFAGASQVTLLPFMNSKPGSHWIIVIVLAILGCGGILWLALFASYNSKAKRALEAAIVASHAPDSALSPYPRPPQA